MAKDDGIYAIPESIDKVMVIKPGDSASAEMIVLLQHYGCISGLKW